MNRFQSSKRLGLALLAIPIIVGAQNLPCNTYGGQYDEHAYGLVESSLPGWVLAGWTTSFGPGTPAFKNLYIVKVDPLGTPQGAWVSTGSHDEEIRSMVRTADGGYAFTGYTRSYGIGIPNANIFILKMDQNLVFQWARVYAGPLDDFGYSIVQTHDGGFAVCGATWGLGAPPWPNVIVLKTDHSGMLQWSKVYWTPMPLLCEEAYGLIQTGAGTPVHPLGYVVVGRMWEDTLARDAFLLRLDMQGNPVLFVNRFTGPFTEEAYSVTQRDSVSYVLAGWTNSWGPGTPAWANIFVSRVMASGPVTWRQVFGWSENDEKVMSDRALISTSDRGFALSGWTGSRGPGVPNTNFLVLKLTPAGQIQWSRVHPSLPGALLEQAYPIVENSQGGFATAGFTSSFGVGGKDFHLLTLNSLGWRPACIDSPAIPADSIPAVPDSMIQYLVPLDSTSFPLEPTSIEVTEVCPLVGVIESGSWPSPTCPLLIAGLRPQLELYVALAGSYQVNLLDCTGRRKAELANRHYPVGRHLLSVPTRLRPGLYYLDIRTEQRHAVRRLIRL